MDNIRMLQMENTLAVMRLMIEGAVSIFEAHSSPLFQLAIDKDMKQEASAFSLLGTALYELRTHIQHLQTGHESLFCGLDASSTQ